MAELHDLLKQKKQDDHEAWLQMDQTKDLLRYLKQDLENVKDQWASGGYTTESQDGTIQLNSMALGSVRSLNNIINAIEEGVEFDD